MTFPHINHPEGGMPLPTPPHAEDTNTLLKHLLAAQNQTNQLLQEIKEKLNV